MKVKDVNGEREATLEELVVFSKRTTTLKDEIDAATTLDGLKFVLKKMVI